MPKSNKTRIFVIFLISFLLLSSLTTLAPNIVHVAKVNASSGASTFDTFITTESFEVSDGQTSEWFYLEIAKNVTSWLGESTVTSEFVGFSVQTRGDIGFTSNGRFVGRIVPLAIARFSDTLWLVPLRGVQTVDVIDTVNGSDEYGNYVELYYSGSGTFTGYEYDNYGNTQTVDLDINKIALRVSTETGKARIKADVSFPVTLQNTGFGFLFIPENPADFRYVQVESSSGLETQTVDLLQVAKITNPQKILNFFDSFSQNLGVSWDWTDLFDLGTNTHFEVLQIGGIQGILTGAYGFGSSDRIVVDPTLSVSESAESISVVNTWNSGTEGYNFTILQSRMVIDRLYDYSVGDWVWNGDQSDGYARGFMYSIIGSVNGSTTSLTTSSWAVLEESDTRLVLEVTGSEDDFDFSWNITVYAGQPIFFVDCVNTLKWDITYDATQFRLCDAGASDLTYTPSYTADIADQVFASYASYGGWGLIELKGFGLDVANDTRDSFLLWETDSSSAMTAGQTLEFNFGFYIHSQTVDAEALVDELDDEIADAFPSITSVTGVTYDGRNNSTGAFDFTHSNGNDASFVFTDIDTEQNFTAFHITDWNDTTYNVYVDDVLKTEDTDYYANLQSYALDFDGTNDYVSVDASDSLNLTSAATISFWIKAPSQSTDGYVVNKGWISGQLGTEHPYEIVIASGGFDRYIVARFTNSTSDKTELVASSAVPLNTWTLVTITMNSSKIAIYYNNALDNSASFQGELGTNTQDLWLGGRNANGVLQSPANIQLDDVAIYNRDLSLAEIGYVYTNKIPQNQTGLMAWYDFNQGGSIVEDRSSNGNDGTVTGATHVVDSSVMSGDLDIVFPNLSTGTIRIDAGVPDAESGQVTNVDDTDNLYAQLRTYTAIANVSDVNGFSTIKTVDLTFQTGDATERVTFRFDEDTATFSELSGSTSLWDLVTGSCSNVSAGNDLDLTFAFRVQWNTTEENDLDLKITVTDYWDNVNATTYDTNYDVVTTLEVRDSIVGGAIEFDGVNNYITCGTTSDFDFTSENFSISFWFKANTLETLNLISRGRDSNDGWEIILRNDGRIWFRTNQASASQATTTNTGTFSTNTWYQIIITRNGADVKIYVNGVDTTDNPVSHTNPLTSSRDLTFGFGDSYSDYFDGIIDEIRIFNDVLNQSEVTYSFIHMRPMDTTNLVGWWRFDELTGILAYDSSGNGNTGTLTNSPLWTNYEITDDGALSFDGSGDYVECGTTGFVQNEGTVDFWFRVPSTDGTYRLIDGGNFGRFYLSGTTLYFDFGGADFKSVSGINANVWYHVVGTWTNGNSMTLWLNNSEIGTTTPVTCPAPSTSIWFGIDDDESTSPLSGLLDDIKIYDRAINSTEISSSYTNKSPLNQTGLVGWWKFDELSGSSASDSSGNGNTGTITGATWVSGQRETVGRFDISNTVMVEGIIYYVNSNEVPPDVEFTSASVYDNANNNEGTASSITNGVFSVPITLPSSVGIDYYNVYINMADSDYSDGEDGLTDSIISDGLSVSSIGSPVFLDNGDYSYLVKLEYDYDSSAIEEGVVRVVHANGTELSQGFSCNSSGYATVVMGQTNASSAGTYSVVGHSEPTYNITSMTTNKTFAVGSLTITSKDYSLVNDVSSTTISVNNSGDSVVQPSSGVACYLPETNYNVTASWLESIQVNQTTNYALSGTAALDLQCTAYNFTLDSTIYHVASNATIDTATWNGSTSSMDLTFSDSVDDYILVSSPSTAPTYITNCVYDVDSDLGSYLVVNHYANESISVAYPDWSTTRVHSIDHPISNIYWGEDEKLYITLDGTAGDTGTIEVYCGSRGQPESTENLVDPVYFTSTTLLAGTYDLSSPTFVIDWTSQGSDSSSGTSTKKIVNPTVFITATMMSGGSIPQGKTQTLMTNATWEGTGSVTLTNITLSGLGSEWATVDLTLPEVFLTNINSGTITVPLIVSVPNDAQLGDYQIDVTYTITVGMSTYTTASVLSFSVVATPNTPTDLTTLVSVGLLCVLGAVMFSSVRKRKKSFS